MDILCYHCKHRQTMNCPNSALCADNIDKPNYERKEIVKKRPWWFRLIFGD